MKRPARRTIPRSATRIDVWNERDRLTIHLTRQDTDATIAAWIDDDAIAAIENGFINPGRQPFRIDDRQHGSIHRSAYSYARDLGQIPTRSPKPRRRAIDAETLYYTARSATRHDGSRPGAFTIPRAPARRATIGLHHAQHRARAAYQHSQRQLKQAATAYQAGRISAFAYYQTLSAHSDAASAYARANQACAARHRQTTAAHKRQRQQERRQEASTRPRRRRAA